MSCVSETEKKLVIEKDTTLDTIDLEQEAAVIDCTEEKNAIPQKEDSLQIVQDSKPHEENGVPLEEDTKSQEENAVPVGDTSEPVTESLEPMEEITVSLQENTVPTKENATPMEESTVSSEESILQLKESTAEEITQPMKKNIVLVKENTLPVSSTEDTVSLEKNEPMETTPSENSTDLQSKNSLIKLVPLSQIRVETTESPKSPNQKELSELSKDEEEAQDIKIKIEDISDEDLLNGLNALENCFNSEDELDQLINDDPCDIHVKEELQLEEGEIPPIYEESETIEQMTKEDKLQLIYKERNRTKETMVKERLKNLVKNVEEKYPVYKELLDKVEKEHGMPFCKLEESRHAHWSNRHTNRWKLKCNRMVIRENNPQLLSITRERPIKKILYKITSLTPETEIEDDPVFPPFVVNVVKKFEEYLNTDQYVQTVAVKNEVIDERVEFTAMIIRANKYNEIMCILIGTYLKTEMANSVKKFFAPLMVSYGIASLYCKSYTPNSESGKVSSALTFVFGQRHITETISNIKIDLTPRTNFWSNAYGIEVLAKTINEFFTPVLEKSTLLEIGCGIGLMSLLFSNRYVKVIGIDSQAQIEEAELCRQKNNNDKILFLKEHEKCFQLCLEQLKKNDNVNVIINSNSLSTNKSAEVLSSIRKHNGVKRIVFLGTLKKQSHILELMAPSDSVQDSLPFFPVKACMVDSEPDKKDHFDIVILMQRKAVRNQSPPESSADLPTPTNTVSPITTEPSNILENVKEQQKILEETTKKLSSGNISPELAAELKDLIKTLMQKTSSLETSLPLLAKSKSELKLTKSEPKSKQPESKSKSDAKDDEFVINPETGKVEIKLPPIKPPPGARKFGILPPLEPNGRIARISRYRHRNNDSLTPDPSQIVVVQKPQAPPVKDLEPSCSRHSNNYYESNNSPRSWNSDSPERPYKKYRLVSPRKKEKLENWDEDEDTVSVSPRRYRRDQSPDYDRYRNHRPYYQQRSYSPRRHFRSRSRSRSPARYSRTRSTSSSRSRSRSPYSKNQRSSDYSQRNSDYSQRGSDYCQKDYDQRSSEYRRYSPPRSRSRPNYRRNSPSVSPPSTVMPNTPSMMENSPPMMSKPIPPMMSGPVPPYLVNRPIGMHLPVQMAMGMGMPMGMAPMPGPGGNFKWSLQEIEFDPKRMPVKVEVKPSEYFGNSGPLEPSDLVLDTPMSPVSPPPMKESVRDPRLRGKAKNDESNKSCEQARWVNGNGVPLNPQMQQQWQDQQRQMIIGTSQWMPVNFIRPGTPANQAAYMMQQYGWGYSQNNFSQGQGMPQRNLAQGPQPPRLSPPPNLPLPPHPLEQPRSIRHSMHYRMRSQRYDYN